MTPEFRQALYHLAGRLFDQAPFLITLLACMILSAVRWRRHRLVSSLVIVSLGLMFLDGLLLAVAYNWIPFWYSSRPGSGGFSEAIEQVDLVITVLYNSLLAVPFALLLLSIFIQRPKAQDLSAGHATGTTQ